MSSKQFVVSLLALAASAGFLIRGRVFTHLLTPARNSEAFEARKQNQRQFTRSGPSPVPLAQATETRPAMMQLSSQAAGRAARFQVPITFEPNLGQIDPRVQFIGRGNGMTLFLMRDEIAVRAGAKDALGVRFKTVRGAKADRARDLARGNTITWRGEEPLPGQSNYFIGNNPRKWRTGVPHFSRVEAAGAVPGVNVAVYGGSVGIEYDLRLAPGADVSKLRVALDGAQQSRLSAAGDLVLRVGSDEITMKRPLVYEEISFPQDTHRRRHHQASEARKAKPRKTPKRRRKRVVRKPVKAAYVLEEDGSVGFHLGPHDPQATLVIDPILSVAYASFLGGAGTDVPARIALDSAGKVYVGGTTTSSTTFPEGSGERLGPVDGPSEFFVAKIDPTVSGPSSLIYLAFLGGSGNQAGGLIAVDSSGDVAITGTTTAADYPVTDTTQPTNGLTSGYGNDVTVSEIDPTGTKLVFSTLFGGSGAESLTAAGGIALDSSGDVYIASDTNTTPVDTNSPDLPVTDGAFQTVWDGQTSDGFLTIFQPPAQGGSAATLKYCSYLGTNAVGSPGVGGVAVDTSGNAYVAGFAANTVSGFPVKNAFQSAYGGGTADAFLMKISPLGAGSQDLVYATELGGSDVDEALGVAVDAANPPSAYVTGMTQSPDFPMNSVVAGYQTALHINATSNAFLAVISENPSTGQTSLAYATYLGGSSADSGQGIAVGSANAVYIAGSATSFDFPWKDNLQPFNGAGDAFVAKVDSTTAGAASLIYGTPLGGTSPPGGMASASGNAVATDGTGHAYVAGITTSGDFPTAVTTNGSVNGFQQTCSSCTPLTPQSDAFIAEIAEAAGESPSVAFTLADVPFAPGANGAPQFVGVLNFGESGLSISNISVTGPNSADFPLTNEAGCIGTTINSGTMVQCSFEIGFTPTAVGPESAVVAISDNAPGSPQILELSGEGGAGPLAVVSPTSVNFGSQPENTTSPSPAVVYLQNIGNEALALAKVVPPGVSQFAIDSGGTNGLAGCMSQSSIPAGAACVVQVSFTPTSQGSFQAALDFFDNSGNSPNAEQMVSLTGAGIETAPIASVAPSTLGYGSVTVGATSPAQSVTLGNSGSAALDVSSIVLTGTNASEFEIAATGTTCPLSSGSIAIEASCTAAIQFAPQSAGAKDASLSFADDAAGSPQQVSLSGTATVAASVTVSPTSLTFGAQSEGTSGAPQTVIVSNATSSSAGIGPVAVTGTNAGDFSAENSCAPSLAAGKSCQISVTFQPATGSMPSSRSATLNVGSASPPSVALSGTATQASISLPTSLNLGSQLAGTAESPVPVVVTNNSSGPYAGALAVSSVSLKESGTTSTDFAVTTDSCTGTATAPGATCSIQVVFQPASLCPTDAGTRNATLTITDNAPGSPHTVPISGNVFDFCITIQPGQNPPQPISAGQAETFDLEIQSSDTSSGSAQLSCAGPANMPGNCTITTTPATNPPAVQVTSNTPGEFQMVVTAASSGAAPSGGGRVPRMPTGRNTGGLCLLITAFIAWFMLWRRKRSPTPRKSGSQSALATVRTLAILSVTIIVMTACGGGGTSTSDPSAPAPQSTTYAVTVTATITVGQATVTRTFTENVTIQSP